MSKKFNLLTATVEEWSVLTVKWNGGNKQFIALHSGKSEKERKELLTAPLFEGNDDWVKFMKMALSLPDEAFQRMLKSFS